MSFWRNLFGKKDELSKADVVAASMIFDPVNAPKAAMLAERYINMDHPMDPVWRNLFPPTKPEYVVTPDNNIGRLSKPPVDVMIASVASCLPKKIVSDPVKLGQMVLTALEHYLVIPEVLAFFMLPYYLRIHKYDPGGPLPPAERCRLYAGVENLLLEIYNELPINGVITDKIVVEKIRRLVASAEQGEQAGSGAVVSSAPMPPKPTAPAPASPAPPSPPVNQYNSPPAVDQKLGQTPAGNQERRCPFCQNHITPTILAGKPYCPECGHIL